MKCHILFSGKNKKNVSKCRLLKILPRVLSVKGNGHTFREIIQNNFVSLLEKVYSCFQAETSFFLEASPFQKSIAVKESKHEVTKVVSIVKQMTENLALRVYPFSECV